MSQWGFYYDQTRCFDCKACTVACKSWNENKRGDASINTLLGWLPDVGKAGVTKYANPAEYEPVKDGQNYAEYRKYHMKENWRRVTTTEYGDVPPNVDVLHLSVSCNHCADPACVKACPMGNIGKESRFGAVLAGTACISCGRCQSACPWGAPQFYDNNFTAYTPSDPQRPRMTKCTLCYERIGEGLKPACVAACVNRALDAGPMEDLKKKHPSAVSTVETFAGDEVPEMGINTKPSIIFKARTRKA